MSNPYLLQQDGFKLLQQDGYGIWLSDNNSRLSKIVAWKKTEYKVEVEKCVKCRTENVAAKGFVLCQKCNEIKYPKIVIPQITHSTTSLMEEKKGWKPKLTTKKIADMYVRIDYDNLNL